MKLFSSPASPYARKVRVLVSELGLGSAIEAVSVAVVPVADNAAMAARNPLAKVPNA